MEGRRGPVTHIYKPFSPTAQFVFSESIDSWFPIDMQFSLLLPRYSEKYKYTEIHTRTQIHTHTHPTGRLKMHRYVIGNINMVISESLAGANKSDNASLIIVQGSWKQEMNKILRITYYTGNTHKDSCLEPFGWSNRSCAVPVAVCCCSSSTTAAFIISGFVDWERWKGMVDGNVVAQDVHNFHAVCFQIEYLPLPDWLLLLLAFNLGCMNGKVRAGKEDANLQIAQYHKFPT